MTRVARFDFPAAGGQGVGGFAASESSVDGSRGRDSGIHVGTVGRADLSSGVADLTLSVRLTTPREARLGLPGNPPNANDIHPESKLHGCAMNLATSFAGSKPLLSSALPPERLFHLLRPRGVFR